LDRFTKGLQSYAAQTKEANEVVRAFQRFVGPQGKPQHVYTDNSKEFIKALEELNWSHDTSTPYRSQTKGVIERSVRVVKEGTSGALVQSGLENKGGPEAMNGFCFLRNVSDALEDGKTAYQRRYNKEFDGPLIAFGAEISYLPITPKDKKRTHALSSKHLPGIFMGYKQQAGGGRSGDLLIVDGEEMFRASSLDSIHIKT
jgi:Integrase core domain.